MMNVQELGTERKSTMIFRKRKKAPTVKYNCDPRFATEAESLRKLLTLC